MVKPDKNPRDGVKKVIKRIPLTCFSKYVNTELIIMQSLDHPRIVKLLDFFPSKTHFNFVMEYASSGSLRDMIVKYQVNHWKFSQLEIDEMFMDMAFGVRYLHYKNIMHRDLKPENILMYEDMSLKLGKSSLLNSINFFVFIFILFIADFGVSKISHSATPLNQTVIGTLSYMAPEVFLHQPYNKSSDIWSLGLILYEMAMIKYAFTMEVSDFTIICMFKIFKFLNYLILKDKARIMNYHISFVPPKINYTIRKYKPYIQDVLEMMVQRTAKKRMDIFTICKLPCYNTLYERLKKEEIEYMIKQKSKK